MMLELVILSLLNRLNASAGDVQNVIEWLHPLADVIRFPIGSEALSSHCWGLLHMSVFVADDYVASKLYGVEVTRVFEETRD